MRDIGPHVIEPPNSELPVLDIFGVNLMLFWNELPLGPLDPADYKRGLTGRRTQGNINRDLIGRWTRRNINRGLIGRWTRRKISRGMIGRWTGGTYMKVNSYRQRLMGGPRL
ncbi:hypothetical protein CRG98_039457 [Punica granatum]|uniref:Uncharacterized protein n=1 Tax=Punica granatum TaxID=22663 RepID=A0A2I0I8M9_PUNGR|nr:hypothetical protein CRG98_039457 [Punica granatum]